MEAERFILAEGLPKDLLSQSYFSKDKSVGERRTMWFSRVGSYSIMVVYESRILA
jgi:hypothetical protein